MYKPKKILFAPLDWGLGHASRCIPLIDECLNLGHTVIIAGDERSNNLIRQEFPQLIYLHLRGYEVQYSSKKWLLPFSILSQIPKIISSIKRENNWLKQVIEKEKIDLVFSDNRYGLNNSSIPCYFITHQVNIQVPQSALLQKMVNKMNHHYMNRFNACLVPDYIDLNMSGELSKTNKPLNLQYLGNLSRFQKSLTSTKVYDILILLSGPEPQRTILEDILINLFKDYQGSILFVRGLPLEKSMPKMRNNSTTKNHLNAKELQEAILKSKTIICRSGYSTIMDLIKLNKHAILIPTPGQTEQEYLGEYLSNKKWFTTIEQCEISIKKIQDSIEHNQYDNFPNWDMNTFKRTIKEILAD